MNPRQILWTFVGVAGVGVAMIVPLREAPRNRVVAGVREVADLAFPTALAAPAGSGSVKLLASNFANEPFGPATFPFFEFVPPVPTVFQPFESPVLASVILPKDASRTHFLVLLNASFNWHRIPSVASVRINAGYQFYVTSKVLPSSDPMPLQGFAGENYAENTASTLDATHIVGFTRGVAYNDQFTAFALHDSLPLLTSEEALALARKLIASEMTFSVTAKGHLRSADHYGVNIAILQVWGG